MIYDGEIPRSCENCKWARTWANMDKEQQRVFINSLYTLGVDVKHWNDYVLCTNGWYVVRRKDYVCEEWEGEDDGE